MLLAVDTSTRWVGLALYTGSQVLGEMTWQSQNTHTVEVAPAVQELLTRAGVRSSDLRSIGVAVGPGSFTSLRIGLGQAKGLAMACRIPLVGIPTLDILAAG
ncbi:MAG TPA: tRNA (adenosine(37)-N6)-threonylcarbamoyltransferase complex dimerization subunit type 1 TsaB, partial [Anaerolineaceae bacterium]